MEDVHPLVRLLGWEAAEKLQIEYGGEEHFDLPKGERAMRAVRDAKIRFQRGCGLSVRSLALENHLTERQIRSICGEMEDVSHARAVLPSVGGRFSKEDGIKAA